MTTIKFIAGTAIAALMTAGFASTAHANSFGSGANINAANPTSAFYFSSNGGVQSARVLNGSDTASHYFKVGVNQYKKGNLEKAEQAFEAVLRAKGLNKQAHYYLAKINIDQGQKTVAAEHAKKMHSYR